MRRLVGTGVVALLALYLAALSGAASPTALRLKPVKCKLSGIHYLGTTEIEPRLTAIEVYGAFLLGTGKGVGGILMKVAPDGRFSDTPGESPSFFKGRAQGTGKATGTLRQHFEYQGVTCDTGSARWSARRAAG